MGLSCPYLVTQVMTVSAEGNNWNYSSEACKRQELYYIMLWALFLLLLLLLFFCIYCIVESRGNSQSSSNLSWTNSRYIKPHFTLTFSLPAPEIRALLHVQSSAPRQALCIFDRTHLWPYVCVSVCTLSVKLQGCISALSCPGRRGILHKSCPIYPHSSLKVADHGRCLQSVAVANYVSEVKFNFHL